MELVIRADRAGVGIVRRRFAALRGRRVRRASGVSQASLDAAQAPDRVAERRRREQEAFGAIGLGGRGFFS